jgi:long-chain fatty acid transport protein
MYPAGTFDAQTGHRGAAVSLRSNGRQPLTRQTSQVLGEESMERLKLLLVVGLVVASPAHATNGMRMIGFGPVQNSMGGVGVGATLDAAAIVTNPAGIADQDARVDVGVGLFAPKPSYNGTGIAPGLFLHDGQLTESNRGPSPIPFVGVVLPITQDLKLGLAASAVAGMGVDYAANLYSSATCTSYLQGRLTPAVGYKLTDTLSIGAGLNVMLAQMKWDVASAFGQMPHDTATSLGIGAVVGVKFTPNRMVSLGAAYETQSWFANFGFDVAAHPNPADGGATTIPAFHEELIFHQPMTFTIGVAVKPLADSDEGPLLIAADVEWINWSGTNGLNKPSFSAGSIQPGSNGMATRAGSMAWNLNWSDQWVVKIGAQMAVTPSLKVRVGYNYGKNPLDPNRAFENLSFPAVQEHHLTAGLGITATDRLTVNLGGMYAPTSSISGSNSLPPPGTPGYPGPFGQGIASYSTRMYQWELDAGISYKL